MGDIKVNYFYPAKKKALSAASPSNLCGNQFVIQRSQLTKKGCSVATGHVCKNTDIRHAHPHGEDRERGNHLELTPPQ